MDSQSNDFYITFSFKTAFILGSLLPWELLSSLSAPNTIKILFLEKKCLTEMNKVEVKAGGMKSEISELSLYYLPQLCFLKQK